MNVYENTVIDPVDILIVEDNPQDADLTVRALRKHNLANNVFVVEDGADALDFVFGRGRFTGRSTANPPKVILLDLKLPKLNGLEVLKALKSSDSARAIPVVIFTSSREDPDIELAYKHGANSYVVKPMNFDGFIEAMSRTGLYWLLVNQHPASRAQEQPSPGKKE